MEKLITLIPYHENSKNCKSHKKILSNIFRRRSDLFAVKPGSAPLWLVQADSQVLPPSMDKPSKKAKPFFPANQSQNRPYSQMQTLLKKGGNTPGAISRKVSRDQCLIFEKNYYSLPQSFINQYVLIFPWGNKLRIYDKNNKHICTHKIITKTQGQYQINPYHYEAFGYSCNKHFFANQVRRFEKRGTSIGRFAQRLVDCHKVFSLRRLWTLHGLICQYGQPKVSRAAAISQNIGDLSKNLKLENQANDST